MRRSGGQGSARYCRGERNGMFCLQSTILSTSNEEFLKIVLRSVFKDIHCLHHVHTYAVTRWTSAWPRREIPTPVVLMNTPTPNSLDVTQLAVSMSVFSPLTLICLCCTPLLLYPFQRLQNRRTPLPVSNTGNPYH